MRTSGRGLDLIKRFEGLELEAYQDVVGVWTIGYGHTSKAGPPDVTPGMEISANEAERILKRDLGQYENAVQKAVNVKITQNMFDALVSITYNIGAGAMRSSTFIKRLNKKDYVGAAEAMHWWNKAGGKVVQGLKNRREAEAALFLEGHAEDVDPGSDRIRGSTVEENSPRRKSIAQSRTMGGAAAGGLAGGTAIFAGMDEGPVQDVAKEAEIALSDDSTIETFELPPVDDEDLIPAHVGQEGTILERGQDLLASTFDLNEGRESLGVAGGVLAVLASIYVAMARIDDWRGHKR